jgi:esterase/lipase superfamily enzyme
VKHDPVIAGSADEDRRPSRSVATALAMALAFLLTGCGGGPPQLMPTPNIYASGERDPFPDVPPALRNNRAEVLYITDRALEDGSTPDKPTYGFKRSRSVAVGVAEVEFGKDVSWEALRKASRTATRDVKLPMTVTRTTEVVRFPPTPQTVTELPEPSAIAAVRHAATMPTPVAADGAAAPATAPAGLSLEEELDFDYRVALAELSARLARTPVKDVYVFVHGYNNNFYDSVTTIAGLWHFLGRQGVPVAYSWPAGHGGLIRGYTYDRESSEFTVYHLKTMLRVIAACPDVHRVHVIAHSRGTDVALSALRELRLEIGGPSRTGAKETRDALKLGTVVLAAPDLDLDVVIQRMVTARLGRLPEHFAMYVCSKDKALGISNWLFGGGMRLGKVRAASFTPEEMETLRRAKTVQIIDAQISNAGAFGHDYFHSNPAVSSDLILLMRYQLPPGADTGRPLGGTGNGFWSIDDHYPATNETATAAADPVNAVKASARTTPEGPP